MPTADDELLEQIKDLVAREDEDAAIGGLVDQIRDLVFKDDYEPGEGPYDSDGDDEWQEARCCRCGVILSTMERMVERGTDWDDGFLWPMKCSRCQP